ncbi:hypothetical protein OCL06_01490 [Alteromonas sp. ASW11-19]|uniref:Type IV pilus biogenesis protein PilP n=1 Tax=Alteromonas salexigens TaxID=2982530 RepID=A0ABT2VJA6_9ALTE|nr:hypothetical protein [Alteromonas salexigens]MCU7553266.1 hypothetical protein [Alteromonas salexigens]
MKYRVAILCAGMMGLAALPAQAETLAGALKKCKAEDNSLQRLVCYDRVVKNMQQYSGLDEAVKQGYTVPSASSNATTASKAAPVPAKPAQNASAPKDTEFGLEHKENQEALPQTMTASVSKAEKTARGQYLITLDNGTVWRQTDNERYRIKTGETVTIERGMLGAFYLSKAEANRRIKVRRVD